MEKFIEKMEEFFSDFGKGKTMVLSTSENNKVSARMVSIVLIDGEFYFQTDMLLKKYRQISVNKNVALCIDNIQIEGECMEIGMPLNNDTFCNVYQECFKGSFEAYSALKNERLFAVKPLYIERWVYKEGISYIEIFDIKNQQYSFDRYIGV